MKPVKNVFRNYPVIVAGVVNVAATLAAHYGLHLTAGQLTETVSFVTALLASVTHQAVTPVKPSGSASDG